MKSFSDYILEAFFSEMPHIALANKTKVVDLEFETHTKMTPEAFVQYVKDWVEGKKIQSKNPNHVMQVAPENVSEFATKVLNDTTFIKPFVIRQYGEGVWKEVEEILRQKI